MFSPNEANLLRVEKPGYGESFVLDGVLQLAIGRRDPRSEIRTYRTMT